MSFVRAVMSVYIILKCKIINMLVASHTVSETDNGCRDNAFLLLCGCYVIPRPLSLSINSGWCLVMTEMLKVWSIGRKSAGKVDQVQPRRPSTLHCCLSVLALTEEHAVTLFCYYSEGGA